MPTTHTQARPPSSFTVFSFAERLFDPLNPHTNAVEVQRQRLISIGIFGFVLLALLSLLGLLAVGASAQSLLFPAVTVGFSVVGYVFSRTRLHWIAGLLIVLPPIVLTPLQLAMSDGTVDSLALISLPLTIIYATVLLPLSLVFMVSVTNIVMLLVFGQMNPALNPGLTSLLLVIVAVITGTGWFIKFAQAKDRGQIARQDAELTRKDQLLATIMGATPDHFVVYDTDGRYLYMNDSALKTMGLRMDQVIGKTWRELEFPIAAETGAHIDATRLKVLRTGKPYTNVSHFQTTTGEAIFDYVLTPVKDSSGEVTMIVGSTRNVTQQVQAGKVQQEQALLRRQVENLQQVISDTSHDLRTPLTSVNTTLHLMKRVVGDPERREYYTQVLQAQVRNILSIVEDMESITRLESGKEQFEFQPLDLNDLIARLLIEYEPTASSKQQIMSFMPDMNLPPVQGDPVKLGRAITNLVTNAIKYTPERGKIQARTRQVGQQVLIEIADSGVGIPADELSQVFERAYRTKSTQTSTISGRGLGLAITRKIIDAHGGRVDVESVVGEGSTFRVRLPLSLD